MKLNIFRLLLAIVVLCAPANIRSFRCVVYGDCRAVRGDPALFNRPVLSFINSQITTLNPSPEFAIFLGDMVNGAASYPLPYTHNNLTDFKSFMEQTLSGIPFYTVVGNNDLYGGTGWTEYGLQAQYQSIFSNMPDNGPTNYKKLVYSFEYGSGDERSLFVILDGFGFYDGGAGHFDNGYDAEQIEWFRTQARSSTAPHKFLLTHGPAFSPEGWPVPDSAREMWRIAQDNKFDMFYCAHEHLYSRWNPQPSSQPQFIQTITAGAGALIDSPSLIKVNVQQAHILWGFNFVVLDVQHANVIHHAYKVVSNANSGFVAQNLDKVILIK